MRAQKSRQRRRPTRIGGASSNGSGGGPVPVRVAILGGDARQRDRWPQYTAARFFTACRDGGNGELRRLLAALRAQAFDLVVILARWNSHAVTGPVRRTCRQLGVRVEVVP